MPVSKEEIIHIAKLAHLNLTDIEIEKYTRDMQEILEFANMINNVDTSDISETIALNIECNIFRKDEIVQFENREKLLKNAPEQENGMFKIPKVI